MLYFIFRLSDYGDIEYKMCRDMNEVDAYVNEHDLDPDDYHVVHGTLIM